MTLTDIALPKAVLWDMDGTLVDTEPYWIAAEKRLVASFGRSWTDEQSLQLVGNDLEGSAAVLQGAGVAMPVPAIVERLTDEVIAQLAERGVPFRPGAKELLASLRAVGVKTAIVTMSRHRMAERVVNTIDFDAFDAILGGDDVERPKPFPDPYLAGAAALGVDIADCVALEDSPTGLASAVASGAAAIGVEHLVALDGIGARAVWTSLAGRTPDDLGRIWSAARSEERA